MTGHPLKQSVPDKELFLEQEQEINRGVFFGAQKTGPAAVGQQADDRVNEEVQALRARVLQNPLGVHAECPPQPPRPSSTACEHPLPSRYISPSISRLPFTPVPVSPPNPTHFPSTSFYSAIPPLGFPPLILPCQPPYFHLLRPPLLPATRNLTPRVERCSPEQRAAKIHKYKEKKRLWLLQHPVNRMYRGRSRVAEKKPREKGRFIKVEADSKTRKASSVQHALHKSYPMGKGVKIFATTIVIKP